MTSEEGVATIGEAVANASRAVSIPVIPPKSINVLFVIDQLCAQGGAETVLLKTIAGLPERVRCRLLTFKYAPDIFPELPCPLDVLPIKRTYDLGALKAAFAIRNLIRNHQIDIVHTFHETSDLWCGAIAKTAGSCLLVSSRRDMGFLRARKHEIGYRFLNPYFDKVLAVSERVRQRCIEHDRLDPARVLTLHNGLDLAAVDAAGYDGCRRALNIAEDTPVVTTVGNIRRVKGQDVLIRAAERICRQIPGATFLIAGEKSEEDYFEELKQLVERLGLARNVKFAGRRKDVFSVLKASQVFCLPSRTEGFSNALIEAMGCGLPCVATDVGGNGEAIRDGENGFLVPSEDSKLLAERILDLLCSPPKARMLGRAARQTVAELFSFESMIGNLVQVYDDLLRSKQPQSAEKVNA